MADVTLIDRNGAESTVTLTSGNSNCSYVVVGTPTAQIIYNKAGATSYEYSRTEAGSGLAASGETVGVTLSSPSSGGAADGVGTEVDIEFPGQYGALYNHGNVSGAVTVDWDNGNMQRLRLTGDVTLTLTNPTVGRRYLLILEQDGTGSRLVTWPVEIRWFAAITPTLSTGATLVDQIAMSCITTISGSAYLAAGSIGY